MIAMATFRAIISSTFFITNIGMIFFNIVLFSYIGGFLITNIFFNYFMTKIISAKLYNCIIKYFLSFITFTISSSIYIGLRCLPNIASTFVWTDKQGVFINFSSSHKIKILLS